MKGCSRSKTQAKPTGSSEHEEMSFTVIAGEYFPLKAELKAKGGRVAITAIYVSALMFLSTIFSIMYILIFG